MKLREFLRNYFLGTLFALHACSSWADSLNEVSLRWSMPIGSGSSFSWADSRLALVATTTDELSAYNDGARSLDSAFGTSLRQKPELVLDLDAIRAAYDPYALDAAGKGDKESHLGRNILIGTAVVVVAVGLVFVLGTRKINKDYN